MVDKWPDEPLANPADDQWDDNEQWKREEPKNTQGLQYY